MVIDLETVSASEKEANRLFSMTATGGSAAFSALILRSSSEISLAPLASDPPVR